MTEKTAHLSVEIGQKNYTMKRYPYRANLDLSAWDAADQYLLSTVLPRLWPDAKVLVVNDNFGALTLPLVAYSPTCYSDSWQSREAMWQNLALNNIDERPRVVESLSQLTKDDVLYDVVVGRIPKSKDQLRAMLVALRTSVKTEGQLLLTGMDKHLSKGQLEQVPLYFGELEYIPGYKKARIWSARVNKKLDSIAPASREIKVPAFDLVLRTGPNVFSRDTLDIGTRFFLDNFDRLPRKKSVADLACGSGVLGLAYLRLHPNASMLFCDESFEAVRFTEENFSINFAASDGNSIDAKIRADDGLLETESESLELILCNPPFHQQNTVSTDISKGFFREAKRCLKPDGELWVVANRHLGYHLNLKKLFGGCEVVASNSKFVILRVVKAGVS